MAIAAVNTIKNATKKGVNTIKAAKGESQAAVELRRQLGISAGLAMIAGVVGFFALRSLRCANEKAEAHDDWKQKDKLLDSDLEDSLDASDAVARY
jgi:hypothetical protein